VALLICLAVFGFELFKAAVDLLPAQR